MKKITMTVAALAVSTLCACAAEVYSSNIVGYQKLQLQEGFNMIANGFRTVGTGEAPALQDMFVDAADNATAGEGQDVSDNIQVWTGTGYTTYYFYDSASDPSYDKKWYKFGDDAEPTIDGVEATESAWYVARSATSLTISGEVSAVPLEIPVQNGYNMVANPFPAEKMLNDPSIDWASMGVVGAEGQDVSDNIQVWTGSGYTTYYFYDSASDPSYDKKWYKFGDDAEPTTDVISAGSGFWFIHRGDGATLNFPSPIAE